MINDFEFDGADLIFDQALEISRQISAFKARARSAGIPIVYANDNFGKWQSDFRKLLKHCLEDNVRGRPVAELLRPHEDDYFVLKPRHSAFYSTSLEVLLTYLGARTLVFTGIATNNCVLFSAADAYMRDLRIIVPSDCVAANSPTENEQALQLMRNVLKADIRPSKEIELTEFSSEH